MCFCEDFVEGILNVLPIDSIVPLCRFVIETDIFDDTALGNVAIGIAPDPQAKLGIVVPAAKWGKHAATSHWDERGICGYIPVGVNRQPAFYPSHGLQLIVPLGGELIGCFINLHSRLIGTGSCIEGSENVGKRANARLDSYQELDIAQILDLQTQRTFKGVRNLALSQVLQCS